jgi:hypothetical protein
MRGCGMSDMVEDWETKGVGSGDDEEDDPDEGEEWEEYGHSGDELDKAPI